MKKISFIIYYFFITVLFFVIFIILNNFIIMLLISDYLLVMKLLNFEIFVKLFFYKALNCYTSKLFINYSIIKFLNCCKVFKV